MRLLSYIRWSCGWGIRQIHTKFTSMRSSADLSSAPDKLNKVKSVQQSDGAKDIIMYKNPNTRFFKILNIFALSQLGFWTVISTSSMSLVDKPVSKDDNNDEDKPFWRKINLGTNKYKLGFGIGSFLMGYFIFSCSWFYILRSIRYLVLRKDRKHVSFVTFTPFGQNRIMDVPLNCISAAGSRHGNTTQMPIKIKDRRLFYILDLRDGKISQPTLFDQTVGLKRKL